ncbi:NHS-like protein 1 isoform X1 [Pantherophis guttatus]|uniref:NHS-like protein 1 isoform X1 n=1 Tax=Pantherophis guttatus TaxID=94885 RepID=A0A6P9C4S0_PANGU|nr:NHS-like protein 1 isoform X1 [Pantherophis guttatus]
MPFPLRTVAPLQLCRLEEGAAALPRDKEGQARRSGAGLLFDSLEEVCSRSLVSLLWQLSDLSRWASDIFGGIQSEADSLGRRSVRLRCRLESLRALAGCLDHRKVKVPVSNLDEESRWTVHYTAPWHQQENVFLPSTRPPCVEELHRQAKLNLKSVLRECDKLRRDGYRSSQYYSQGPTFSSSSNPIYGSYQDDYEEIEQKCSTPSPEEEKLIPVKRPKTPTPDELSDINTQTNWTKSLPLPTPEEKMRQQAQAVPTDVIPINVTGENFDRQASIRRSLIYTDTVVRRPKKMKRRKTITGVPDNIQRELVGNGKYDIRGHSLCVPDHYSTLGRLESCQSSMQQCGTKDSSCQTEEVKVVPPSVRRIRAQKGQGIAAQMSQLSSSSGNMSVMSDSAGVMSTSRLTNDLGFHSLPRSAARVSLQLLERRHSLSKSTENGPLLHHVGVWQENERMDDMRNGCRINGLQRPKSQELNSENGKTEGTTCMISPRVAYSTIITPKSSLSSSSDVMNNNPGENSETIDRKMVNSSLYLKPRDNLGSGTINAKEQRHSSNGTWSDTSSTHHSHSSDTTISSNGVMVFVSFCDTGTTESIPQSVTYNFRNNHHSSSHSHDINGRSESSYTVDNIQDKVKQNAKHCGFKHCGNDTTTLHMSKSAIPGCSSSDTLERVLAKEDSHSLYSVDSDVCYPSMHGDSDVQSVKSCNENGFANPRHSVINVFAGTEKKSLEDFASSNDKSLTRNISLKKAKKPPLPPSRTDSLRRTPKNKPQSSGQVLDDKLIASLQHSLQLNLQCKNGSSPSQSPCSDYDDPWVLRSRSQSTVSASSSMMSATGLNMYSICAVTPAQSDTSSIKSEYTDQWCYYSDYPGIPDDHLKSTSIHSSNTVPKLIDYNVSHLSDGSRASIPQVPSGVAKTKAISPEKSQRVTSPSSGYSSQSNTPTALTPVPVILKSMSTGNAKSKMKPRVPERKSSLLSSVSVSSSSTSLSSNTSAEGTVKKPDPTLSFPPVTSSSLLSSDSNDPLLPPPPPPLTDVTDLPQSPESPNFPPPPPDVVTNSSFPQHIEWFKNQDTSNHSSHSLLPDSSHHLLPTFPTSVPPPAPPLDPKFMRDGHKPVPYSFKKHNLDGSCNNAKQPLNKDDVPRPAMPLITTEALQMVQLRSVKKAMKSEVEQSDESASKASPQEKKQDSFPAELPFKSHLSGGYSDMLDAVGDEAQRASVCCPNSRRSEPISAKMPRNAISIINSFARESQPDKAGEALVQNQDSRSNLACSSLQEQSGFLSKPQDILPNKKPPPVSKKPKLFLIVPPPQPDVTTEKIAVGETAKSIPSTTTKDAEIAQYSQVNNYPTDGFGSYEMESNSLVSEGGAASPISCETRVSILQPQQEETASSCERSSPDRNVDSISGAEKQFSHEDESSEAIEADAAASFLLQSPSYGEGSEIMAVPSRPRTTEDLFAAIHRSKRKVLGRKDSEEDHAVNHSPSPPVTPTGSSPNLLSLRQAGSIQRNIRKSSTSNDNFKALLLKKGSRSDTSSRMSAAEMLKNTDPRFQRTKVDSIGDLSESIVGSPTKTKRPQEEWAKSEGLMPRSLSLSSTRYSRSRTPPSAASSKYSARNRIQSSPMTVISEGDVEVVESAENRTRRFSEEEPPDVFESDDTDINENRDSAEDDNMLKDLLS